MEFSDPGKKAYTVLWSDYGNSWGTAKEFLLIMHFTKQLYFFINSTCHYIENSSCVLPRFPNTDMLFCHCMLDAVLDHTSCGRVLRPASSCSACAYINYESIFDFWPYYIPDILGKWKYYELLEEWDTSDEFAFWRKYFILCQIIYQKFQKSENILSYKISENIFFICPLNNLIFQIWEKYFIFDKNIYQKI